MSSPVDTNREARQIVASRSMERCDDPELLEAARVLVREAAALREALDEVPMPSTDDPGIYWDAWEKAQKALAAGGGKP